MNVIPTFLNRLSNDPKCFLPLPFLWKVTIDTYGLRDEINKAIRKSGDNWRCKITPDDYTDEGSIMVAQNITIPNEAVESTIIGSENVGAFLPCYGMNKRTNFASRGLGINFIETDIDIEHNFFRPWLIALSVDGLLNHGLKANITLVQYGTDGNIRKGYRFLGVYPTAAEGYTLDYESDDFKIKSVTFGFHSYHQILTDAGQRPGYTEEVDSKYLINAIGNDPGGFPIDNTGRGNKLGDRIGNKLGDRIGSVPGDSNADGSSGASVPQKDQPSPPTNSRAQPPDNFQQIMPWEKGYVKVIGPLKNDGVQLPAPMNVDDIINDALPPLYPY